MPTAAAAAGDNSEVKQLQQLQLQLKQRRGRRPRRAASSRGSSSPGALLSNTLRDSDLSYVLCWLSGGAMTRKQQNTHGCGPAKEGLSRNEARRARLAALDGLQARYESNLTRIGYSFAGVRVFSQICLGPEGGGSDAASLSPLLSWRPALSSSSLSSSSLDSKNNGCSQASAAVRAAVQSALVVPFAINDIAVRKYLPAYQTPPPPMATTPPTTTSTSTANPAGSMLAWDVPPQHRLPLPPPPPGITRGGERVVAGPVVRSELLGGASGLAGLHVVVIAHDVVHPVNHPTSGMQQRMRQVFQSLDALGLVVHVICIDCPKAMQTARTRGSLDRTLQAGLKWLPGSADVLMGNPEQQMTELLRRDPALAAKTYAVLTFFTTPTMALSRLRTSHPKDFKRLMKGSKGLEDFSSLSGALHYAVAIAKTLAGPRQRPARLPLRRLLLTDDVHHERIQTVLAEQGAASDEQATARSLLAELEARYFAAHETVLTVSDVDSQLYEDFLPSRDLRGHRCGVPVLERRDPFQEQLRWQRQQVAAAAAAAAEEEEAERQRQQQQQHSGAARGKADKNGQRKRLPWQQRHERHRPATKRSSSSSGSSSSSTTSSTSTSTSSINNQLAAGQAPFKPNQPRQLVWLPFIPSERPTVTKALAPRSGLLFIGTPHAVAVQNMRWLLLEVLPRALQRMAPAGSSGADPEALNRARRGLQLVVGGSGWARYLTGLPHEVAGLVTRIEAPSDDQVRRLVDSRRVFVAPLHNGTGVATKIVNAMASSIAVVTTSAGLSGVAQDGQNNAEQQQPMVAVADDPEAFAGKIVQLIQCDSCWEQQVRTARGHVLRFLNSRNHANILRAALVGDLHCGE